MTRQLENNMIDLSILYQAQSTWQIADKLSVSQTTIRRWLKKQNIKTRSYRDNRLPDNSDSKHGLWVGESVSYSALHSWVSRKLGTPSRCEHCKRTDKKKYEWANISKEYFRDLDDWIRLCTSCHRYFDQETI